MERIENTAAAICGDRLAMIIFYQQLYDKWPVRLLVKWGFAFSIWSSNVDKIQKSGDDFPRNRLYPESKNISWHLAQPFLSPEFNFFCGDLL